MSTETGTQHRTIRRHTKSHLGSGPKANTARISMARDLVRTCACGCGEPVAARARYKVGHYRAPEGERRECTACGRSFKIAKTSVRETCWNRNCPSVVAGSAAVHARFDARKARLAEQMQLLRANWTIEERRIMRAQRRVYTDLYAGERRAERDVRLRQIEATLRRNAQDRERQTSAWLDSLSPEDRKDAVAILDEQSKDENRLKIQYEESLDRPFEDGDQRPIPANGVSFDREDDIWPYIAERARRVNGRGDSAKGTSRGCAFRVDIRRRTCITSGRVTERWASTTRAVACISAASCTHGPRTNRPRRKRRGWCVVLVAPLSAE